VSRPARVPSPPLSQGNPRLGVVAGLPRDWDPPELDGFGPVPAFPLDVLPPPLADFCRQHARSLSCPVDYLAVPLLAIAGGAIGRSIALRIKDSWIESPCLYAAVIGDPGVAKTPALKTVSRPLWRLAQEYKVAHEQEAEEIMARKRQAKEAQRKTGSYFKDLDAEPPKLRRVVTVNATCEALASILAENPRGLTMVHDELTAWLNGMNQYKGGSGDDRQFWLQVWSGASLSVDRKSHENRIPIVVRHPFIAVCGMMTPDMLNLLPAEDARQDGFLDRILFSFPQKVPVRWRWDAIDPAHERRWESTYRKLGARPTLDDPRDGDQPSYVRFEDEPLRLFARWYDAHNEEAESLHFSLRLVGPWAKMRAYCARFALILDQLHWAASDATTPALPPPDVGMKALLGAFALVDYFKSHYRKALATLSPSNEDNLDARAILEWAIGRGKPTFTARDARGNFRARFAECPEAFTHALTWLADRNAIRKAINYRPGPGRKPSDSFEINPKLLGSDAQPTQNSDVEN
jgi:hypothetical protein